MTAQWQHYAAATIDFQHKPNSIRLTRSLPRGNKWKRAGGWAGAAGVCQAYTYRGGGGAICTFSDLQVLYCRALDSTVPLGSQRMGLWFLCHLLVFAPHFHGLPDELVNISRVSDSHLLLHRTHIYYLLLIILLFTCYYLLIDLLFNILLLNRTHIYYYTAHTSWPGTVSGHSMTLSQSGPVGGPFT